MAASRQPDLVIAIDFGMICTGVAYANLTTGSDQVNFIQKWPGRAYASENKVPTSVVYSLPDRRPIAWGFASDAAYEQSQGDAAEYRERFKTLLDPSELHRDQNINPESAPESMEFVESYYIDFLRLLYGHIAAELSPQLYGKTWNDASIEFIFSLPSTWTDKSIVERFRSVILNAGFATQPLHTVDIGLTEAEAAAVQVSKRGGSLFRQGDVMLVCDAGGGTTHLSILQVSGISNGILSLSQMDVVQGRTIGGASIDADFERLARQTLVKSNETIPLEMTDKMIQEQAWAMMKSDEYHNMKCEFGSTASSDAATFSVAAKKLSPTYVNEECRISEQRVVFDRSDFQEIFDKQLHEMFELIDNQLQNVEIKMPGQRIMHLIVSGGLGNSPYVLEQLKTRYEMGGTNRFPSTEWLRVRAAPEPQLAVCKGIVEDRVQKLSSGQAVLAWRCCRESYGVACKELYDAVNPNHANRQTAIDAADGRLYVVDGVDWFIKAGDPVSSDQPIVHDFFRIIAENDTTRIFNTPIYVSRAQDTRSLPNYLAPGSEIYQLCNVVSNLQSFSVDQFEAKGRQPWSRKRPHWLVRYQIRAIVGPGDLRFELWFNGNKVNVDQAINVEWFAAPVQELGASVAPLQGAHQSPPQIYVVAAVGAGSPPLNGTTPNQPSYPLDPTLQFAQTNTGTNLAFRSTPSLQSEQQASHSVAHSDPPYPTDPSDLQQPQYHQSTQMLQAQYHPFSPQHQESQAVQPQAAQYQTYSQQPLPYPEQTQMQYSQPSMPNSTAQLSRHTSVPPRKPVPGQAAPAPNKAPVTTPPVHISMPPPMINQPSSPPPPPIAPLATPPMQTSVSPPMPTPASPPPAPAPATAGSSTAGRGQLNLDTSGWKEDYKQIKRGLSTVMASIQKQQEKERQARQSRRTSFFKS